MATTRCPHCYSVYSISDEQYNDGAGIVRCGTCRQSFTPTLIETAATADFDPEQLEIEPISERPTEADFDLDAMVDRETSTQEYDFNLEDNIQSELTIAMPEGDGPSHMELDQPSVEYELKNYPHASREEALQSERAEAAALKKDKPMDIELPSENQPSETDLINEVDQLIEEKLLHSNDAADTTQAIEVTADPPFRLKPKRRKRTRWEMWLGLPLLLISVLVLGALLIYQLWLRQALPVIDESGLPEKLQQAVAPVLKPLQAQLGERYKLTLPARRDLSGLELVSARTQAHPSRSSTLLLRVSLANRSDISQALPWLELTLSDQNGQLVARRALTPDDYIYNNDTQNTIGPNELKSITIELLAFPERVTGYELKLLDK